MKDHDFADLAAEDGKRTMKTSERIARQLVDYIVREELDEGTVLPTEKELVQSLAAGRASVREALRILETRGVLIIKPGPGGGPVVRWPQPGDLSEALTLHLQFTSASQLDVLEAREALEPMLARLAAERSDRTIVESLRATIDDMRSAISNHTRFLAANHRFHGLIAEAGANHILRVYSETLMSINDGALQGVEYTEPRRSHVADAHESIVDAIEARDGQLAGEKMGEHIRNTTDYWTKREPTRLSQHVSWE